MEIFEGLIIEKVVRRSGISITEVSRKLNVNRRTIYYWFNQEKLNNETISKLGHAIGYDFSKDLPNYSKNIPFSFAKNNETPQESTGYWRDKYIDLLEQYNTLLVKKYAVA